jgi:anti-sigma regulatory factor (Ser/Thr protein kinase)
MSPLSGGELVAVMRRGFRREIDALDEVFRFLEDFIESNAIRERTAFTINLVVEELFTNMVRHNAGGGDAIDLSIERVGDHLHLGLIDFDVDPFDPAGVPPPPVAAGIGERRPGGLGLHLVRAMVDELDYEYETETRRMRVSVTTRLES